MVQLRDRRQKRLLDVHHGRQRDILKYVASTFFGFMMCRLTSHSWCSEHVIEEYLATESKTIKAERIVPASDPGAIEEYFGTESKTIEDELTAPISDPSTAKKLYEKIPPINNTEPLSFRFGSRSEGVEPKRNVLNVGSLCATYDSKNDKHKWTTDEGRCIYEYFIASNFIGKQPYDGEFHGTVLEMGVTGSIGSSHSYTYQFDFGWNTILVEGNPYTESAIKKDRVENKENPASLHMTPICTGQATYHFVVTSETGYNGFREFNPKLLERIQENNITVVKEIPMKCHSMSSLLGDVPTIDAYFLDVEGYELLTLKTIDFQKTCIQLFNIEAARPGAYVHRFLQKKGFSYVGWNTEKWNSVFVNNRRCRD